MSSSNGSGRLFKKFDLEDNPIENVEGKKRHCSNNFVSNVFRAQDSLEIIDERVTAHIQQISVAVSGHVDRTK